MQRKREQVRGGGGVVNVSALEVGYCVSDIISKCGVGIVIYQITYAKSQKERSQS